MFKTKKALKAEIEALKDKNTNDIRAYANELSKSQAKIKELEDVITKYKQQSFGYITDYLEEKEVDETKFFTNEFATQFSNFVNNESHTETEILNKFNELINKEKIYYEGILSCLDFIRTKRNKKISTEKQLLKYILTDFGRESVDLFIDTVCNNTGETNNE